ncbi:Nodule Cysteine-Rich [Sesbania bispinosa]|nr:Nodule Cysteine-Rich [Sesbania bispinosa]
MTAFLQPHQNMACAAAVSRESNITHSHGCIGLHCPVADDVEDNLFMYPQGSGRMLATKTDHVTSHTQNAGQTPDCPPNTLYTGTSCIGSPQLDPKLCAGPSPYCRTR